MTFTRIATLRRYATADAMQCCPLARGHWPAHDPAKSLRRRADLATSPTSAVCDTLVADPIGSGNIRPRMFGRPNPHPARWQATVAAGRPNMTYENAKRTLDIALALLLLIVGLPLWLLVAGLIKLDSAGPVFYTAVVHGRGCRPFRYYKFRTMRTGAPTSSHEAFAAAYIQGSNLQAKLLDDRRVTRVGRLLRVWSLDEIPQLLNVLRGDMSLVGPRPPLTYELKHYDARARRRLAVRPGITGLQQVTSRGRASFCRLVATDLLYIRRRSLALDLTILVRTIPAVLSRRGAA